MSTPDFGKIMQQAKELEGKLKDAQQRIKELTVEGKSGAGIVTVTMNGTHQILKVSIHPDLLVPTEKEILEDLVAAAVNDAARKVEEAAKKIMEDVAGGMGGMGGFGGADLLGQMT